MWACPRLGAQAAPCSGSDPSHPLGRWQLRQHHVRGREGRPGAAGRPALRGDPAGLGAELHVRHPFPAPQPPVPELSLLLAIPPRSDSGGQGAWGLQPLSASLEFTRSRLACPQLGSPRCLWKSVCIHRGSTRGPGGTPQGRDPVCPLTPSSSQGLPSAKEDEDVAALRAAPHPHPLDPLLTHHLALNWGNPGWGQCPPRPLPVQWF